MKKDKGVSTRFAVFIFAVIFFLLNFNSPATAVDFITIDPPGALQSFAHGINDSGQIVGFTDDNSSSCGFIYNPDTTFTIIPMYPGGVFCFSYGINNAGTVVGIVDLSGDFYSDVHGFKFESGVFTLIDFPGAINTKSFKINDLNQIIGNYVDANGGHGFLLDGITFTSIDVPWPIETSLGTNLTNINNNGTITGIVYDTSFHGITYDINSGLFTQYDFTDSFDTRLNGTNDDEVKVGNFTLELGGSDHGLITYGNEEESLDVPGETSTVLTDINNDLDGVGYFTGSPSHAFQFKGNKKPADGKQLILKDNGPAKRRIRLEANREANDALSAITLLTKGASLCLFNDNGSGEAVSIALPKQNWKSQHQGRNIVYKDNKYLSGPCRSVTLSKKKLRLNCNSSVATIDYSLNEPSQGKIGIMLISGSNSHCTVFGGNISQDKAGTFSARNADTLETDCSSIPLICQ